MIFLQKKVNYIFICHYRDAELMREKQRKKDEELAAKTNKKTSVN